MGGDGGCRVGEVRAGTTSPMPNHKVFFSFSNCQRSTHSSTLRIKLMYNVMKMMVNFPLHLAIENTNFYGGTSE